MKLEALNRLTAKGWQDTSAITFKATGEAQFIIPKLLRVLAYLGSAGASRTITVEDVPASSHLGIKEGDMKFGFDGDGADKITDITVDGEPYEIEDAFEVSEVKATRQLRAAEELMNEDGFNITTGGNSFKCHNPGDAYAKAAAFIRHIEHDGFKFTSRGAMSNKMDVFKKGGNEISVSVRNSILNIDLW